MDSLLRTVDAWHIVLWETMTIALIESDLSNLNRFGHYKSPCEVTVCLWFNSLPKYCHVSRANSAGWWFVSGLRSTQYVPSMYWGFFLSMVGFGITINQNCLGGFGTACFLLLDAIGKCIVLCPMFPGWHLMNKTNNHHGTCLLSMSHDLQIITKCSMIFFHDFRRLFMDYLPEGDFVHFSLPLFAIPGIFRWFSGYFSRSQSSSHQQQR